MNTALLLEDLKDLNPSDFNYKYAYNNRETGVGQRLNGTPLDVVLKTHTVCISGFLMSKFGFESTKGLELRYGLNIRQLVCIIYSDTLITFDDGSTISTPTHTTALDEVIKHIHSLIENENWVNDKISKIEPTIEY